MRSRSGGRLDVSAWHSLRRALAILAMAVTCAWWGGLAAAQAPAMPGELWLVSGDDQEIVRRHRGVADGDGFGAAIGHDVLPGGLGAGTMVGAPGADFPRAPGSTGRVVAIDDDSGEVLLTVDAPELPGASLARLGHALVDLGHVGSDAAVHWAVGAPGDADRRGPRPAVVILHGDGSGLVQRDRVTRRRGSLYGWALTSLGLDRNGGSFLEGFAVGAPAWKRGGRQHAGAVEGIGTETARRRWRRLGAREHGHLGYSLAFVPDRDGDGEPELLVGAPGTRDRAPAGAVHLLSARDGRELARLEGPEDAALFGFDLAVVADLDGDGFRDFAVGAPATAVGRMSEAGVVFLVSGRDGAILGRLDGDTEEGWFGAGVAASIDQDGDGVNDLAVASLTRAQRPRSRHERGRAAVLALPEGEVLWSIRGRGRGDRLGASLFRPFLDADDDQVFDFAVSVTRSAPSFLPE